MMRTSSDVNFISKIFFHNKIPTLKKLIHDKFNIPPNEQHIVFKGELLKDTASLRGIEENDQLTVLTKVNCFLLIFNIIMGIYVKVML